MSSVWEQATNWIRFVRGYGPIPRNENMFDEFIRASAARLGVTPLDFNHPAREEVVSCIVGSKPTSVILTGTAGDGKTYLCRKVWEQVGGDPSAWDSAEPYRVTMLESSGGSRRTLHVISDLSAWAPTKGAHWPRERQALLEQFSASLWSEASDDIYLIAANDGQLVEAWRRLAKTESVIRALEAIETLLVENRRALPGIRLSFFNLSRFDSARLMDNAIAELLSHAGWDACRSLNSSESEFFGSQCPIRRNLELLGSTIVRTRLVELLSLCDYNQIHIPIRQILLLLSNALLGHPDVRDRLMRADDIPVIIRNGTVARASLFSNLFGGNLGRTAAESRMVFDALGRFGIGYETTNRVDNILVFGHADDELRPFFDRLVLGDRLYGLDDQFRAAQREYLEGADEELDREDEFLSMLIAKRRQLFFSMSTEDAVELRLWELTVFKYAGEYLDRVVAPLSQGKRHERALLLRLVRGLNRIFTGMLFSADRELLLVSNITASASRVSRLLEDQVSVEPRLEEGIAITLQDDIPTLEVALSRDLRCSLPLFLTRYEFIARVAEGALPNSFSRECYEDILAFRSRLLTSLEERRTREAANRNPLSFRILEVDEAGKPAVHDLEVKDG